jgi:hypothetical protein
MAQEFLKSSLGQIDESGIKGPQGLFDFVNYNAGTIQVLSTVILVLVTVVYAYYTRQAVKESEKIRKDNKLPVIKPSARGPVFDMHQSEIKGVHVYFDLENIGDGLALDVRLYCLGRQIDNIGNIDVAQELSHPSIEFDHSINEHENLVKLSEDERTLTIDYRDLYGRKIQTIAVFDFYYRGNILTYKLSNWRIFHPN